MANRAIKARDLCATCYDRMWKKGLLPQRETVADQVLEILELDGGWLTEAGVRLAAYNTSDQAVHKALFRLRDRGLVESRLVHGRNHWRAL